MASTTLGHRADTDSAPQVKSKSGFGDRWRRRRKTTQPPAHAAAPMAAKAPATTQELPAVPEATGSRAEVVVHHNPGQLDPTPVLAAIARDAARALGGEIPAPEAAAKLHRHLGALDHRLQLQRRFALNLEQASRDVANLLAADQAATAVGATLHVDPESMVDAVMQRADHASRPDEHTRAVPLVTKATEFAADMGDGNRPTIGQLRPASELDAGDFLLDVDATDAPDPLSMWRAVASVAPLGDDQLAVTFKGEGDRTISVKADEQVWILPPVEGRRQRDAAPSPVRTEQDSVTAPVPAGTVAPVIPLPQRDAHPAISVLPAAVDSDGEPTDPMRAAVPGRDPLDEGAWVLDEGSGTTGPIWLLLARQRGAVLEFANGHRRKVSGTDQVDVLDPQRAKELIADVEARRAEVSAR